MKRFNLLSASVAMTLALICSAATAGEFDLDFETDPTALGVQFFGSAEFRPEGGNPGGYLKVTDAANGERGAIVFPDLDGGQPVVGFNIGADLRVGGGTDQPADGFSFNFARPSDPALDDGEDFAASPTGEANLPEEGTTTGLAIGFDEWFSGGDDVIGMSVRIDNELVSQIELPTLNGELSDTTSLQTGPLGPDGAGDTSALGWARLEIELTEANDLSISYKGNEVFNDTVDYAASPGQLLFAGRTGGANAAHHIDNISVVTVVPEPGSAAILASGLGLLAMFFRRRRR